MKKLLTLLAIFFGLSIANAQTEAETLEWLNVKKVDIGYDDDINFSAENMTVCSYSCDFKDVILWKNIKEITIENNGYSNQITIKGKVTKRCLSQGCKWDNREEDSLYFICSREKKELQEKFVKALKHIAEMKGAKFIKDDLF